MRNLFSPLVEVTSRQRAEAALLKLVGDQPAVEPFKVKGNSAEYIRLYMRKYRAKKRRLTGKDR
jgi:hypothetical protein